MGIDAWIVIAIVIVAVFLFAMDRVPSDLVSIFLILGFVVTGILTTEEALSGFSNPATITVAFMFVLSNAILKTGSLQRIGPRLGDLFKKNDRMGLILMIGSVGLFSAFINNTPIVAMFIPVMVSVAHQSGTSPSRLLIPLSYASILGGTCTLIGTSTNILVSGIAQEHGLAPFSMFLSAPIGLVFLTIGAAFLYFFGNRLLPDRKVEDMLQKNSLRDFVTEIEIQSGSLLIGKRIMESVFSRELEVDIIEIQRNEKRLTMPPGDFVLHDGDILKIRCDVGKIKEMKDRLRVEFTTSRLLIGENSSQAGSTTLIELILTKGSDFEGRTLRELDFRGKYRAVPLAILHRQEVIHEKLHDVELQAGDIILVELKAHRLRHFKKEEMGRNSPFIILSEEGIIEFEKKTFWYVAAILAGIVLFSAFNVFPVVINVLGGVSLLILGRIIRMKELYQSIEWRIVFLLAGAICIGMALDKTGLAADLAMGLTQTIGSYGPVAVIAGLYLVTSLMTELMSNTATAALFTPIAIATANQLELSPTPFLVTVMLAASASFMTPIGYQTNAMVYIAGQYRFMDFLKIGIWLNLLLWLAAVLLIPLFYPF